MTLMPDGGKEVGLTSSTHKIITVEKGATLALMGNGENALTIDGKNTYGQLIYVEGNLLMENGAKIINGKYSTGNSNESNGGCVYIADGGAFAMNGGTISGGVAWQGAGVYVDNGRFTMSGGSIERNAGTTGGGVYVKGENARFQLSGQALIQRNTATNGNGPEGAGGGVYICEGAVFTMTGGTVTLNRVESGFDDCYGGGIAIHNAAGNISGGTISANEASTCGGGISSSSGGGLVPVGGGYQGEAVLTITGNAKIINNIAGKNTQTGAMRGGGGIYNCGTLNVEGGVISGNEAHCGGGIANQGHRGYPGSGVCNITGGKILNNSAATGGGIGNDQTVNISGGTISGNTAATAGAGVYQDWIFNLSGQPVWGQNDEIALVDYYHWRDGLQYKTTISKAGDFTFKGKLPITLYSTSADPDKTAERVGRNLVETNPAAVTAEDLNKFDVRTSGDFIAIYTETDAEQMIPAVPVLELAQGIEYQVAYYYQLPDGSYTENPAEIKTFTGALGTHTLTPEENITYNGVRYAFDQTNANNVLILELENPMPGDRKFKVYYKAYMPKYTVTYDANGGEGAMIDPKSPYKQGDTVTALPSAFTYATKSFAGWIDGRGNSYAPGTAFIMPAENVVLYAQWKDVASSSDNPIYNVPKTGDVSNPALWLLLLGCSVAGMSAALLMVKRSRCLTKNRK